MKTKTTKEQQETLEQAEYALQLEMIQSKRELLKAAVDFTARFDPAMNQRVLLLMDVLIAHTKDTNAFKQSDRETKDAIQTAIDSLKGGGGGGIEGGDWIDNVGRFIEAIFKLVENEKRFFFDIIKLLYCGCDGKGN